MFATTDFVMVETNFRLDPDLYRHWLDGFSEADVVAHTVHKHLAFRNSLGLDKSAVQVEVNHLFSCYQIFDKQLHHPEQFRQFSLIDVCDADKILLTQLYYGFDCAVVRELLGKRLNAKERRDLDDVAELSRTTLKSCRRQFDNLKRVYKYLDELDMSCGSVTSLERIKTHFQLKEDLARQYLAMVFLSQNHFEMTKKKLMALSFNALISCAHELIANWTLLSSSVTPPPEDIDIDMDKDLLHDLRDGKVLLDKEVVEELRRDLPCLREKMSNPPVFETFAEIFKPAHKQIVLIGTNLTKSRELRDYFLDILEKVVELFPDRCQVQDLETFFNWYTTRCVVVLSNSPTTAMAWNRYLQATRNCILIMHHELRRVRTSSVVRHSSNVS